jgi:flagellar hook-basal body complex protein FliE
LPAAKIGLFCAKSLPAANFAGVNANLLSPACKQLRILIMTDRVDISRLLGDMRALKAQTQVFQRPQGVGDTPQGMRSLGALPVEPTKKAPSFGDLMTQAVNKVNDVQQKSSAMADAYECSGSGYHRRDDCFAKSLGFISGDGAGAQ